MEAEYIMKKNILHINGIAYDAARTMERWMGEIPLWEEKGWEFLIQLLDPSNTPVQFITSGTTGTPQRISFTKEQIFYSAENTCRYFNIQKNDVLLLCLPAQYVAGRMMIARALFAGAQLTWVEPSLNPLHGVTNIQLAAFTPAQVATIWKDPDARAVFASIPTVIIGGGEISFQLEKELSGCTNTIFASYGMTETLTHVAVRKIGTPVYEAVYPEVLFSVNENNCLCIELPRISNTRIITSDVVEWINPTHFIWKGRLDHVINSGGIKLQAEQMEKKIMDAGMFNENEFYISSKEDQVFGRVPVIVLLKKQVNMPVAELLTSINGLLNKHEAVKHVIFIDKFEYTATGKLIRSIVHE
jgi:O-succinylbenzoic acid--CoA ligase